jgi:hypothetical protein
MRHGWFIPLLLASLCWLGSGCAMPPYVNTGGSGFSLPTAEELPGASMKSRGKLAADASAVAPSAELDRVLGKRPGGGQYVSLSAPDLQCLAAARSSLANLIEMEREILACTASGCRHHKGECEARMKDDLLALRAVEERNRSAGAALELYYRLAESEAGLDILQESQAGLDHALANIAELREQGIKVEVDEHALARRKIELADQQAEAELGREQSHGGLKLLLNLAAEDPTRIWPAADLAAVAEPLDVEAAVAMGLASRAELIILRCLIESLTVQTLPGARAALSQRDPSLGTSVDLRKLHLLLAHTRGASELPGRRAQLAQLLDERERTIAEEIRANAATMAARLRQAGLAQQIVANRKARVTELEKKRELGMATPFEIAAEKLEVTKAEGELMRKVVAWRIAQVKLRQSQGLLAAECGFYHEPCCAKCGRVQHRHACSTCGPYAAHSAAAPTLAKKPAADSATSPRIVRIEPSRAGASASLGPAPFSARSAAQTASRPTIRKLK